MAITAKEVNELRAQTGAGMMDCKKALEEAGGDFDKAIEYLRKKGQKVSASRQDRDAKEGSIFVHISADNKKATLIEINCETDFVAKNDDFQKMGNDMINAIVAAGTTDASELSSVAVGAKTVGILLDEQMARIGEKIEISKLVILEDELVVSYIHAGSKLAVLIGMSGTDGVANAATIGRDLAMQIAAMSPIAVDKDGVDPSIIEKEIEIGKDQARQEGKPEAILEKIAVGKLGKFFEENTLLEQGFVKDPSKKVIQYLKEAGPNLKVNAFKRIQLGVK